MVPADVYSLQVLAIGARGGRGRILDGGIGGSGVQVSATIAVRPLQSLYIYVGGVGKDGGEWTTAGAGVGGYNGGGNGSVEANTVGGGGGMKKSFHDSLVKGFLI